MRLLQPLPYDPFVGKLLFILSKMSFNNSLFSSLDLAGSIYGGSHERTIFQQVRIITKLLLFVQ